MRSSARHKRFKLKSEINVVPYIDVMLVLLIIFMVTAPMMNLGVDILGRIDASNVDADTFDASVQATGLNDTGSLAASMGAGVQGLMTSQIGTWRQRSGAVPDASLDHRLSA